MSKKFSAAEIRRIKEFLLDFPGDAQIPVAKTRLLAEELNRPKNSVAACVYRVRRSQMLEEAQKFLLPMNDDATTLAEQLDRADKLIGNGIKLITDGIAIRRRVTKEVAELEGWAATTIRVKSRLKSVNIDQNTGMVIGLKFEDNDEN